MSCVCTLLPVIVEEIGLEIRPRGVCSLVCCMYGSRELHDTLAAKKVILVLLVLTLFPTPRRVDIIYQ